MCSLTYQIETKRLLARKLNLQADLLEEQLRGKTARQGLSSGSTPRRSGGKTHPSISSPNKKRRSSSDKART